MSHEHPAFLLEYEDVRGLDHGIVKAIGKRGGDVLGAGYPADAAFNAEPDRTESHANAPRVCEKSGPAIAHFVPSKQKLPAGMNAFHFVVVSPDSFHLSDVQRFEGGIKPCVCGTKGIFRSWLLRCDLCGHVRS